MTELTIDQALQQAIESHKAGQVQEADRLYTAILKAQPKHPDANHNMGVLAVSVGKVEQALPFFKTALEANPAKAQFWLSYIDALIKLGELAKAKAILDQAKSKGAKGDGFDKLEQRLNEIGEEHVVASKITAEVPPRRLNILDGVKLDQALKLAKKRAKEGSLEEAKRIYRDILTKFPKNKRARDGLKGLTGRTAGKASKVQNPPQDQLQVLNNLYSQGQLQQALKQAGILVQQFPQSAILFNIQGAVLKGLGQLDASVEAYNKALAIKPDYAEARYNMGNALKDLGKLEEAIKAYTKVLSIQPDNAEAYNNMGNALREQDKLEEAIEAYNKVLAMKPHYAETCCNIGVVLQKQGKLEEAVQAYIKALAIQPDYTAAYYNMGNALKEQGKLEEAIRAYNKALAIKPDYAEAYFGLAASLYIKGDLSGVMKNLQHVNSNTSEHNSEHSFLRLPFKILTELRSSEARAIKKPNKEKGFKNQNKFPLMIERAVEPELIKCLYELSNQSLDDTKDARYGPGRCSSDFKLFEAEQPIIKKVSLDLLNLMENALGAQIFLHESFFNILGAGGGTRPHHHIKPHDRYFDLHKYKYSLVYYLSVGDQNCTEPGILKLYEPDVDILPTIGVGLLIPATRNHSAIYNGMKDRIMIGCNFYAL